MPKVPEAAAAPEPTVRLVSVARLRAGLEVPTRNHPAVAGIEFTFGLVKQGPFE